MDEQEPVQTKTELADSHSPQSLAAGAEPDPTTHGPHYPHHHPHLYPNNGQQQQQQQQHPPPQGLYRHQPDLHYGGLAPGPRPPLPYPREDGEVGGQQQHRGVVGGTPLSSSSSPTCRSLLANTCGPEPDPALQEATSSVMGPLRKKRSLEDKICRICGDKALAHNFDVITCESCKAFFRRNALKREELKDCAFQRSCPINIRTRRFCSACRLKKCFAIGMRADMILDENKRRARMEKLSLKRKSGSGGQQQQQQLPQRSARPMSAGDSSDSNSSSSNRDSRGQPSPEHAFPVDSTPCPPLAAVPPHGLGLGLADNNGLTGSSDLHLTVTSNHHNINIISNNNSNNSGIAAVKSDGNYTTAGLPYEADGQHCPECCGLYERKALRCPDSLQPAPQPCPYSFMPAVTGDHHHPHQDHHPCGGSVGGIGEDGAYPYHQDGQGFEPVPVSQLPSDPHMYWRLTEEERALLTQITATYQDTILRLPRQGGASERAVNSITLEDLLGRCDVCANNVVKLMKGLADYRTLQVEDQLAALKACAMRTLILKGAACFVVERDAWIKAYGELPVSLFVRVTGHEKLIRQHAAFCRALKVLLKNDVTMYALLQCVMLFDPRQPNIADRQLINTFRDKYLLLLKHYLESQVSYVYAEQYLDHLKERLAELTVLGQKMTDMFKEWTGLIQPLMIEVLSLA